MEVEGVNRHDMKLVQGALKVLAINRPNPTVDKPQNLCLDKGNNYPWVRELVEANGYKAHIRVRGEEADAKKHVSGL